MSTIRNLLDYTIKDNEHDNVWTYSMLKGYTLLLYDTKVKHISVNSDTNSIFLTINYEHCGDERFDIVHDFCLDDPLPPHEAIQVFRTEKITI